MARRTRRHLPPVHFRFTVAGWMFLALSIPMCVAAVNVGAPLMFILLGAMLGALHVSAIVARRTVSAVRLSRDVPSRVWQNQTVHLGYYLSRTRRRGSSLGLRVEEIAPLGLQCAPAYCVNLEGSTVFRAGGRFAARRRGRIRVGKVRVSTVFPFGLISAYRTFDLPADLLVWPARGRLKRNLLRGGAVEASQAAPSPATGGQDEFFGVREYRPDDNPRWIHWRRSANRPSPVVREMARPMPEILMVVLDAPPPSGDPSRRREQEQRIRFAGTLIDHAIARGYQVGLAMAHADRVTVRRPAPGRGQLRLLMDDLADAGADSPRRLADVLARIDPRAIRSAIVAVVSPDPAGAAEAAAALPGRCRHLAVLTPADLAGVFVDDPLAAAEEAPCP